MDISLTINDKIFNVSPKDVPIETTLTTFIRETAQLTGTKEMCKAGGCGVCVVVVSRPHPVTQKLETFAVNSCLKSIFACHGFAVFTVEFLGSRFKSYHALQETLIQKNGSQCGFCTPGMVMNLYGKLNQSKAITMEEMEKSFSGNICRCTGYRPILEWSKSFATDATEDLVRGCQDPALADWDIEDLSRYCPKRGAPCTGSCPTDAGSVNGQVAGVLYDGVNTWYRATKMQDLFDAWARIQDTPSMLIAGNTARGITPIDDSKAWSFIDINPIAQLYSKEQTSEYLLLGSMVSLTDAIEAFRAASSRPGFEYFQQLLAHIELVANVPVRNAGTIGGNLCYKNLHHDFPSDVFLCLNTCDASVTVVDKQNMRSTLKMHQFLGTDMKQKLLYNVMLPKLDVNAAFRTYKVMIRAQNAHAYVNAGFYVRQEAGKVAYARICYGGINPEFLRATNTENLLIGRDLYTNETLQAAIASLSAELKPDFVMPDASPEYRRKLAIGLFYRFVLSTSPPQKVSSPNSSGARPMERPLTSGTQTYQTDKTLYPLTEPINKYEGMEQSSGEAKYINDMPAMKDQCFAAIAVAEKVGWTVATIVADAALAVPGVISFHSLKDIPGKNDFAPVTVFTVAPEPIFVGPNEQVLYNGQPVGVICASTREIALRAAKLVQITYMQTVNAATDSGSVFSMARSFLSPLLGAPTPPVITTLQDAMENLDMCETFQNHPPLVATSRGTNPEVAALDDRFDIGGQYHFMMEPQTCICVPAEKGIDVHSSTQWIEFTQMAVAGMLAIPEHSINIVVRRLGGAFGAKITRATQFACIAALPCRLLNRPVRLVAPLELMMQSVGKRYSLSAKYEVGVDKAGAIQRLKNRFWQDGGCSVNEDVTGITKVTIPNVYNTAGWDVDGHLVKLNCPSNTFFRCPGTLEGIATTENIMDHIRWATGLDEIDVRLANMTESHPMRKILKDFINDIGYAERKAACDAFNAANKWVKRGIAVVPMQWPLAFYGVFSALVAINHKDGTACIVHGGIEMGQGINTKAAQVAAHMLGINFDQVSVKPTNNVTTANSMVTGGSVSTESVCHAVKKACEMLLERMAETRSKMPVGYTWPDLTEKCHLNQIDLRATYQFAPSDSPTYNIYGACKCEVMICATTGEYMVCDVQLLEDVGRSANPKLDAGQVEGAFIMGLGYWTCEKLVYDRATGQLMTNNTWTYKTPGARDIPVNMDVKFIANSPNPDAGVLRSKAVGEPATAMSIVVMFALRYAINAFRKQMNPNANMWFRMGSGTTPEDVLTYCEVDPTTFKL